MSSKNKELFLYLSYVHMHTNYKQFYFFVFLSVSIKWYYVLNHMFCLNYFANSYACSCIEGSLVKPYNTLVNHFK